MGLQQKAGLTRVTLSVEILQRLSVLLTQPAAASISMLTPTNMVDSVRPSRRGLCSPSMHERRSVVADKRCPIVQVIYRTSVVTSRLPVVPPVFLLLYDYY